MTPSVSDLWAVVLAGGAGTRLWPVNRDGRPKFLLKPVGGERSLLDDALLRAKRVCGLDRVCLVASPSQAALIREECAEARDVKILEEPARKDTLLAVALAAAHVSSRTANRSAPLLVVPTDHLIPDHAAFGADVVAALASIEEDCSQMVLFGVKPIGVSVEYGHLRHSGDPGARLLEFVEKPGRKEAEALLADGAVLWNTGIFLVRCGFALESVAGRFPGLAEGLRAVAREGITPDRIQALYRSGESTSFERGVVVRLTVEERERVRVREAGFQRHDLGSYEGLARTFPPDGKANRAAGDVDFVESKRSLAVASNGRKVALLGVEDLVVVEDGDVVMVAHRDRLDLIVPYVRALRRAGSRFA